jgi:hypothetical protein
MRVIDITGQKFGKLLVCAIAGRDKKYGLMWKCECECGRIVECRSGMLRYGAIKSCGCSRRKMKPADAQINRAHRSFVSNARRRGLSVQLTKSEWLSIVRMPCYYCNAEGSNIWVPVNRCYGSSFSCNGVDRLDSNKNYTKRNSVSCCKHCNIAKNSLTVNEFLGLVQAVYNKHLVIHA